ncbi:Lipase 4 [Tolypocladium capitatum]|uniref:Lipase 4 n=1 Tax=Tolypocladium capitatum TaxID=45235 RepID=A0A2K3QCK3_9HYPO|nr:Lipase 4 [Tolypocladium capitatum]
MLVGFRLPLAASLLALAASVTHASPLEHRVLRPRAVPPLPSTDSFYAVPDGLAAVAPGTILNHRPPPNPIALFGTTVLDLQAAYQILYRTTDSLQAATATVLTVLVPPHADFSKILSYQVAEDSAYVNCGPSYAWQQSHSQGPENGTLITELELLLVQGALDQGWVVIAPDFLGPNAAFLANGLAGHATLDGIRAAINSASFTGIRPNPTISMWGYSGGAQATLWAAELQPSYAAELNIAGAAAGGPAPNLANVIAQANGKASAGLIAAGFAGLSNQYPEVLPVLDQHLLPQNRSEFEKVRSQCYLADGQDFTNKNVLSMFDDPTLPFTNALLSSLLTENGPGQQTPHIPLFIYKAVHDEISPVADTDGLVAKYCHAGVGVTYEKDSSSDHSELAINGAPRALSWLISVMNGHPPAAGCTTTTVLSSLLDPGALLVLSQTIIDALRGFLGTLIR